MKLIWMAIIGMYPALFAGVAFGQSTKPHVHGAAELTVAIDGGAVEIELHSPLDNLVGFEHAPRNERQRRAIASMKEKFGNAGALFVPNAEAQCTAQPATLDSPVLESAKKPPAGKAGHSHGHGHAALDAAITFHCKNPQALKYIDVELFAAFPSMKRLQVQLVTPTRQQAASLTPARKRLTW